MLATPFTPVTNCPIKSTAVTSTITMGSAGSLTVSGGSAVVNGVVVTSFPISLQVGDSLAIRTTTSALENTATYVTVTFGTQSYIVTFVTVGGSESFDPTMIGVPYYENTTPSGAPYTSTTNTYSVATNGVIAVKQTTATPGTSSGSYQVMLMDPFNHSAHLIGSDGVLISNYALGDAAWCGTASVTSGVNAYWFGEFTTNKVAITQDGVNWSYLTLTGAPPVAIATNIASTYIYVAQQNGNMYTYQGAGTTFRAVSNFTYPNTPTSMTVDTNNNLYVVSMNGTTVTQYSHDGTQLASINIGNMPTGIAYANNQIFISCAIDQTIVVLSTTTMQVTATIPMTDFPALLTIDPTDSALCVTCFSSPNVYRFDTTSLLQIDVTTFGENVIAAYSFGSTIIADHAMYDAKSYLITGNSLVPGLGFFENDQEPISTTVQSTTVTATRITVTVPVSIPSTLGASIVKNGTNIGTSGTVEAGDQFYITFTTPSTGSTFTQIPCAVGNYVEPWNTTTAVIVSQPKSFSFSSTKTTPSTVVSSSSVTISGLTPGTTVNASVTSGTTVTKNGVSVSGTFSVTNGDVLVLKTTSSATTNGIVASTLTVGTYSTTWYVLTSASPILETVALTKQPLNTTVSGTFTYSGTGSTLLFGPGVTVTVNGNVVLSGAVIPANAQVVLSSSTGPQYASTSSWSIMTLDGYQFNLTATTVTNCVPYPMDFGVLYDIIPSEYYTTITQTTSLLSAPATISWMNAGTLIDNGTDSGNQTITNVANGSVLSLNVYAQASTITAMTTIPVYALDNDGVTEDVIGSVRVIPVQVQPGNIEPQWPIRETALSRFFRYKPGSTDSILPTAMSQIFSTIAETETVYNWKYSNVAEYETGYTYTTIVEFDKQRETNYAPIWSNVGPKDNVSSYTYHTLTNPVAQHESSYTHTWYSRNEVSASTSVEKGFQLYAYTQHLGIPSLQLHTAVNLPIGNGHEVKTTYTNVKTQQYALVNATYLNAEYEAMAKVKVTYLNAEYQVMATWNPGPYNQEYQVMATWGPNPYNQEYQVMATWNPGLYNQEYQVMATWGPNPYNQEYQVMAEWSATPQDWTYYQMATWQVPADTVLPGYWLTEMPVGYMPPGCMHGFPDLGTFELQVVGNSDTEPSVPYTIALNLVEADIAQAMSYEPEVNPSVQTPTLFGGFATEADANQFISTNAMINAYATELSNGYWIVLTSATDAALACAIVPAGKLHSIGWLLQGG